MPPTNINTYFTEYREYVKNLHMDKSKSTILSYTSSIERFLDHYNINDVNELNSVTSSDMRSYQGFLLDSGLSKNSVNCHFRPIKAFLNYLIENEYIVSSPLDKVRFLKADKKMLAYLSEKEVDAMINAPKKLEEKLIIAMLIALGLRRSELVNIKMDDVVDNTIVIFGKGNKERCVYMPDDIYELYQMFLKKRKDKNFPYLFRSKMGCRYSTISIYAKVKKIARLAGIDESRVDVISPHTLRRTFATNLVENGVDIRVIQGALGHSSINTTMRYANLRNSAVARAMMAQKLIKKGDDIDKG